ncbi:ankyrin repeat protein [Mollivirus sibericum]|uniref:ankyrin repeat protein n=1 Tax=Mollivirus sibericum TaxID=1678078 RepID=UPI0006B2E532|nr:ankyrin repeat protein [Mollivirus sibericum]ALD62056.1 ankyrin repeat protein [Mollivirus sibericum]
MTDNSPMMAFDRISLKRLPHVMVAVQRPPSGPVLLPFKASPADKANFEALLKAPPRPSLPRTIPHRRHILPAESGDDDPKDHDRDTRFYDRVILPRNDARMLAVLSNKTDVLDWLCSHGSSLPTCLASYAASLGNWGMIKWLQQRGCVINRHVADSAACSGHIHVLERLIKSGCALSAWTFAVAARANILPMLECLKANKCPWDKRVTEVAAAYSTVAVLKWLISNKCPYSSRRIMAVAALANRLDIIEFMYEGGAVVTDAMLYNSLAMGNLKVAKWTRERNDSQWTLGTAIEVASRGHVECMEWMLDNGCPYVESLCLHAAAHGKVEMLSCFRDRGHDMPTAVVKMAAANGQTAVISWWTRTYGTDDMNGCLLAAALHARMDRTRGREALGKVVLKCFKRKIRSTAAATDVPSLPSIDLGPPAKRRATETEVSVAKAQDAPASPPTTTTTTTALATTTAAIAE